VQIIICLVEASGPGYDVRKRACFTNTTCNFNVARVRTIKTYLCHFFFGFRWGVIYANRPPGSDVSVKISIGEVEVLTVRVNSLINLDVVECGTIKVIFYGGVSVRGASYCYTYLHYLALQPSINLNKFIGNAD
jgi:hypothetical protein